MFIPTWESVGLTLCWIICWMPEKLQVLALRVSVFFSYIKEVDFEFTEAVMTGKLSAYL